MKKANKRIIAMLMVIMVMLSMTPTMAFDGAGTQKEEIKIAPIVKVNPIYEDIISQEQAEQWIKQIQKEQEKSKYEIKTMPGTVTYYETTADAGAYLREQLVARESSITLNIKWPEYVLEALSQQNQGPLDIYLNSIIETALKHTGNPREGDYLSYQWGSLGGGQYGVDGYGRSSVPLTFGLYTNSAEEEAVDTKVNTVLNGLNLDGLSKYKKFKKIYAWICKNIVYDESVYTQDTDKAHTAYKGLIEGTCVCQGYACILYRFALESGIDARIVSGDLTDGGGHAWNIVQMGEKYYLCDSTWDSGIYEYIESQYPLMNLDEIDMFEYYENFLKGKTTFAGHETNPWTTVGNTGREDIMTTYNSRIDTVDCVESAISEECTHNNRTKVNAKNPTCTADGNIEYWQCASCEAKFTAQTGGTELTGNAWKIAATGHHEGNHVAAKTPTCTADGNYEYWTCVSCDAISKNSNFSELYTGNDWFRAASGHQLGSHVAAKSETCTADGNYEYYECSKCHIKYKESTWATAYSGETWKRAASGHQLGSHVAAKAPTCTADGNYEYYECSKCNIKYKESTWATAYSGDEWKIAKHHTLTAHPAVQRTAEASGNTAYWSCSVCGKYFSDADALHEIVENSWITPPGTNPPQNPPSGGGGDIPVAPTTGNTEGVSVEQGKNGVYQVSDESKIKGIIIDGCMTESVEINFSTGLEASTDGKMVVSIPSQLVTGTKDKDKGMKISSEVGTVEFNSDALKKVAKGTVTISIKQTVKNDRTNIDISMKSGKKAVTKFGTGTVAITAPLPTNVSESEACVVYVSSSYVIDMGASVSNGNVMFNTNHFSTYSIMNSSTAKPNLIKSIKKSTLGKIKASSTKKAVKLTWNSAKGNTPTETVIYRSMKAKKGFKKIETLTNGSKTYTDKAKLKKGKKYYYKVCGSYTVDGKKYNLKKSPVVAVKHK